MMMFYIVALFSFHRVLLTVTFFLLLSEKRGELVRPEDELWKWSARNNWPSQEFGGELVLCMPYVPLGIKETRKKTFYFFFTFANRASF